VNASALTSGQSTPIQNVQGFTYDTYGANSIYNGLQVRLQNRVGRGLMLNAIYTYGKSLDNASTIGGGGQVIAQSINDLHAERGLSSFDMRHQFRFNYSYEFPLGERHRFCATRPAGSGIRKLAHERQHRHAFGYAIHGTRVQFAVPDSSWHLFRAGRSDW